MGFKIYTKTGDKGQTALFGGKRVGKDDIRIEAYGTIDELNSFIGALLDSVSSTGAIIYTEKIQEELFIIGSHLARDPEKVKLKLPDLPHSGVDRLEKYIDQMDEELPDLKHFVLPGGSQSISWAHISRTVCRRAERRVVSLSSVEKVDPVIIIYLNRLSDFLFTLARFLAKQSKVDEKLWLP
jgi:cob(I)alamin adenosyltransferase